MQIVKTKIHSIDALRALSIVAVILIHTTTKSLEASHYNLLTFWPTLLLNQIARFAVPLFFLISGFVLQFNYGAELDFVRFIKKRFSKILIPYIFWSLFYYFFIYTQNSDNLLWALFTGSASYQLYFIPTICIFYLLFPLLHKFYKIFASIPVLSVLTAAEIFLMRRDYFVRQFDLPDPIRILILGYLFFIFGMVAAENKDWLIKVAGKIKYFLIPALIYLIYYIFEEGKNRYYLTYNIEAFYSQWRPDVLIYTLVLAFLLFYAFDKMDREFKIFEKASRLSYLVFFIHVVILEEIWKHLALPVWGILDGHYLQIATFDVILFIIVAGLSFGAAYLIHRIPYIKKITG